MALKAGVAVRDISPRKPMFLAGYPHVERISEGVHDPLLASAICVDDGRRKLMIISLDLLFVSPAFALKSRKAIEKAAGVPASDIMICCTHTHSGPLAAEMLAWGLDPLVPPLDQEHMDFLERSIVEIGIEALRSLKPAKFAWTSVQVDGVGGNRHSPGGVRDPEAGLLAFKDALTGKIFSVLAVYSMHPTVLHEDSKLASADFPGAMRAFLKRSLGEDAVAMYLMGPSGNQSPRYYVKAQTFEESDRLGRILGEAVFQGLSNLEDSNFREDVELGCSCARVELAPRPLPSVAEAETRLKDASAMFESLKRENAPRGAVRTAECAVFGAEEALFLSRCQEDGRLAEALREYGSLELQSMRIGDLLLAGLPCEIFVEYGLELKLKSKTKLFAASLANGNSQGYVAVPGAEGYEADNGLFDSSSGARIVAKTLELAEGLRAHDAN